MYWLASLFPPRRRAGVGVITAVGMTAVIALALLPFRAALTGSAPGLAFVVPVVVATAVGGAVAAVVAVVAGFLTYNALFTTPYLTLEVAEPADVIGLLAFVVVGAMTAMIVSLRQREADVAREREEEALGLYDLSRSFVEGDLQAALDATVATIRELFAVESVAVISAVAGGGLPTLAAAGAALAPGTLREVGSAVAQYQWSDRGRPGEHRVPLLAGGRLMGLLVVIGDVPSRGMRMLPVFANHVALALHRAELASEATRVKVLEETDRVRAALIRSVSHDLRTPLSSIIAAGDDLGDAELDLSLEDRQVLARTIAEEGRRLDSLVTNLLDLSRIESGRLELRQEAVEMHELVDAALPGSGALVTLELAEDLPPVWVDPLLIEQVLRNLVDNATRHAPSEFPVRLRAWHEDDAVVVAVEDRGPGVPDGVKGRVFVPFRRVSEGSLPSRTGVGLAICKAYVEAHGGQIEILDTHGGGATFRFALPLAEGSGWAEP